MKCYRHIEVEAQAICSNCGRAVCAPCITSVEAEPVACSHACATRTHQLRRALEVTAAKTLRQNSATARFLFLAGGAFCLVGTLFIASRNLFLIAFPIGLGIVNIVAGFWFRRLGRQDG